MDRYELKYGCNPNQKPAGVYVNEGKLPFKVLNARAGYINLLDAFNSWQLVSELKEATGLPAAASFKHVSPAGAAVGVPMDDKMRSVYFCEQLGDYKEISPIASAYIRARGADRMSSYGDFIALSEECDVQTALYLAKEVSDGIIAPSYSDEALRILKKKKRGTYLIMQMDASYKAPATETREVFGIKFEQGRNNLKITKELFTDVVTMNKEITETALRDMMVSMIVLKYTQSNSVCYVKYGQAIGIGAGQQSRIHCVRMAGEKADKWFLRQSPEVLSLPFKDDIARPDRDNAIDIYLSEDQSDLLVDGEWQKIFTSCPDEFLLPGRKEWLATMDGIVLGSDAFFPFGDSIERAHKSGVRYVVEAGGARRDDDVIASCDKYNMLMVFNGVRLFHH